MKQVYIVGAGPGDPELLTLKGKRVLESADVIIYAGSLVNPDILAYNKKGAVLYNSASMHLEEVLAVMKQAVKEEKSIVRLHTGDPCLYGAIQEQMDALEKDGISYEVIPGVSSFQATAAALCQEYTLPEVSQTVIITRLEGRTPVPQSEKLSLLASHKATLCIFLSIQMLDDVIKELLAGGAYTKATPMAVVYRASWPDQKILRGTIGTMQELVKEAGVTRQAMIVVGNVLDTSYEASKLYDKHFTHMFRGE